MEPIEQQDELIENGPRLILAWPDHIRELHALLNRYPTLRRIYLIGLQYPDHPVIKPVKTSSALPLYFEQDNPLFAEGRVSLHFGNTRLQEQMSTCRELQQQLLMHTRQQLSFVALRATRGWHILANEICNLPLIQQGADQLSNCWKNEPVIIVGAGPSLDDTAPVLHQFRNRARIIACDGAWHTLAQHNIVPDLVVTADDSHNVWKYFDQLPSDQAQVPVLAMLQSCCHIARHHKGPIYFARNGRSRDEILAQTYHLNIPLLHAGLCVGHLALEAAKLTGAQTIIMTGFDLGFKNDRFHPSAQPNPYYHDEPPPPENLLCIPANEGGTIRSELSMNFYRLEFEARIARLNSPVINATAGGARVEGTDYRPLADLLAQQPERAPSRFPTPKQQKNRIHQRLACEDHETLLKLVHEAINPALSTAVTLLKEDSERGIAGAEKQLQKSQPLLEELQQTCTQLIKTLAVLPWPRTATQRAYAFTDCLPDSLPPLEIVPHALDPNDLPALWQSILQNDIDTIIIENGNFLPAAWSLPGLRCINIITDPTAPIMPEHKMPGYQAITCY